MVDRSKGSARHKVLITRCRIGAPIYRGLGSIAWYGLLAARGPITPTPQSRPSGLIPCSRHGFFNVIAGLVPAIHGFTRREKDVAGRREDGRGPHPGRRGALARAQTPILCSRRRGGAGGVPSRSTSATQSIDQSSAPSPSRSALRTRASSAIPACSSNSRPHRNAGAS